MKMQGKILRELNTVARTTLYFATVYLLMMTMKKLYLKDYDIQFSGISQALLGSLVMAKVIILMEFISLGKWVQRQPAIVDIILRTLLYTAGVLVVIVLEKAFEDRHEAENYGDAILYVFTHRDIYHVWATTIGSAVSIFGYNGYIVLKRSLGKRAVINLFFSTPLNQVENQSFRTPTLSEVK